MKNNLQDIFVMQKQLDEEIFTRYSKTYGDTFAQRKLALIVELAELANEVRSFKYWSTKGPSAREVILDEYADGLHFISGFAIMLGMDGVIEVKNNLSKTDDQVITKKILKLFKIANKFKKNMKDKRLIKIVNKYFSKYLELGYCLGFKFADMKNAYLLKHETNKQRQIKQASEATTPADAFVPEKPVEEKATIVKEKKHVVHHHTTKAHKEEVVVAEAKK